MSQKNAAKLGKMVEELNDIIEQTYYFEQKVYEWTQKINANKLKISKAMGRKNRLDIKVDENTSFNVNKIINHKIEFFEDQLQQNLDKEVYNKVINKTVTIKNLNGLIKFLKGYGVDPKEFKNFIETSRNVDVDMVDELVEIGEIQLEDIQGCYKVEFDEQIKVRKNK